MKKNIIIIIVAIILVGGGVVLFLFNQEREGFISEEPVNGQEEIDDDDVMPDEGEQIDPLAAEKSQLIIQARAFIERYGSYSLDSGYQNLQELLDQMSKKLTAEVLIKIEQGMEPGQDFFAFVTKIGSIELEEFIPGSQAIFTARVQQQEMRPGETNISYYTVDLSIIKEDGQWVVDEIEFKQ
ncbi:unnamed protein product [marine sediment metagenome]|uniref:Uncharacterized protein n=1 Tax=marine sediment metagenome TaxID=412755 RepID=X1KHC8_9ZZZZ